MTTFPSRTPYPKTLLYAINPNASVLETEASPGFFPASNNLSRPVYEDFVSKLEAHIGVNRTVYDFCRLHLFNGACVWKELTQEDRR